MTNAKQLNNASQEFHAVVGTMLDNPAAAIRVDGGKAARDELAKIAALRGALAWYERELLVNAFAG